MQNTINSTKKSFRAATTQESVKTLQKILFSTRITFRNHMYKELRPPLIFVPQLVSRPGVFFVSRPNAIWTWNLVFIDIRPVHGEHIVSEKKPK